LEAAVFRSPFILYGASGSATWRQASCLPDKSRPSRCQLRQRGDTIAFELTAVRSGFDDIKDGDRVEVMVRLLVKVWATILQGPL